MTARSAIVLVIDRLGASWLGPYGNTWIETPHFNQFARESLLVEYALADSPELEQVYRSYWTGRHALAPEADTARETLFQQIASHGINTVLVTDDAQIAEQSDEAGFHKRTVLTRPPTSAGAITVDETSCAQLFAASIELLHELTPPSLLWIHSQGMQGSWDAPLSMRNAFAAEDDPTPPEFTEVPCQMLEEDYDPDELLGIVHAYAGQVTLLDECLGAFLTATAQIQARTPQQPTLTLLTSPRGFPLGEHRRLGNWDNALYSEALHVPCMVRLPDGTGMMCRTRCLIQPTDVHATIADWFGLDVPSPIPQGQNLISLARGDSPMIGDRAAAGSVSERLFRTPAWLMRVPGLSNHGGGRRQQAASIELYVKPDDRFEVNDVADRCPDVMQAMCHELENFETALRSPDQVSEKPLPERLLKRWE